VIDPREVDWEAFYERMYGHPVGDKTGERLANIVTQMGTAIMDFILGHGDTVVAEVRNQMQKARVPAKYLPYVFFTLMESKEFWPSMTPDQEESLKMALRIMNTAGKTPSYQRGLQVPDFADAEAVMDQVILGLAVWADKPLRDILWRGLGQKVKAFAPEVEKILKIPATDSATKLLLKLRQVARNNPGRIEDHTQLLDRVLDFIHWL